MEECSAWRANHPADREQEQGDGRGDEHDHREVEHGSFGTGGGEGEEGCKYSSGSLSLGSGSLFLESAKFNGVEN